MKWINIIFDFRSEIFLINSPISNLNTSIWQNVSSQSLLSSTSVNASVSQSGDSDSSYHYISILFFIRITNICFLSLLNCRRNSILPQSGRITSGNHLTHHVQFKTYSPFRFRSNRPGDKIEQVLAHEISQSRNVSQLVRPFFFTIGVREFCVENQCFFKLALHSI